MGMFKDMKEAIGVVRSDVTVGRYRIRHYPGANRGQQQPQEMAVSEQPLH